MESEYQDEDFIISILTAFESLFKFCHPLYTTLLTFVHLCRCTKLRVDDIYNISASVDMDCCVLLCSVVNCCQKVTDEGKTLRHHFTFCLLVFCVIRAL